MAAHSKRDSRLVNHPSVIENAGMKFLIFDAPSDDNIEAYVEVRIAQTHMVHIAAPVSSEQPLMQFLASRAP